MLCYLEGQTIKLNRCIEQCDLIVNILPFYRFTILPFYPFTLFSFFPFFLFPFTILPFYHFTTLPFYHFYCLTCRFVLTRGGAFGARPFSRLQQTDSSGAKHDTEGRGRLRTGFHSAHQCGKKELQQQVFSQLNRA